MGYFIPEDVGTTIRGGLSKTKVLAIWERHKGVCVNCGRPIDGARDKWFCEHIRALELGGTDTEDNLGPAHWECKRDKDAEDHARAAEAKREKCVHLGIKDPHRKPLPFGRNSNFKRRFDGTIVDRRTGQVIRGTR
ncbi:HNH endonuclease [Microvirga arsenatis]|uniref:HNH nuclease domain-containing protein n=1 Tax=Microvirga arsenatis TaxID=2692265 RepID=A0ABW9YUM1_9HYPH|nr:HNH endonuclease signature motif containing protein [Microvirga arsenatis]NBJ13303.1 hypothetical protein [Microvirga arsenatis]NBJ24087.1 hypothetical protein [Microvirga arsenatis]